MILDKNRFSQGKKQISHTLNILFCLAMFHTVTTVSGHKVSFTELYLIPVIENDITVNYVSAKQIKIDDVLYVTSNDHLIASTITTKIMKTKSGYYASLTMSGGSLSIKSIV
ncbi:unnamed protein product [Rotaria sp. Silwood1]|nr:unnamed protein product [Rotaria sp. Silwood1]